MILIISQEAEQSTDEVLKYLLHFEVPFSRLNYKDVVDGLEVTFGEERQIILTSNRKSLNLNEVKATWYRRGQINLTSLIIKEDLSKDELELYSQYYEYYKKEVETVLGFIYNRLKKKPHINSFLDNSLSKLIQLDTAQNCGLKVPKTIFTNSINKVMSFLPRKQVIQKAIDFQIFRILENKNTYRYSSHSSKLVFREHFEKILKCQSSNPSKNDKVLISCLQEYIDKEIELRIFYLSGKFFSMAIFSQQNEKTKIDWRNYDYENPNRTVPFSLPIGIKHKLSKLMTELDLNSGSIDMIYTPEGEYVFLEVNPIGQFDWLSKNCNFYIEKEIAKILKYESEQTLS